MPVPRCARTFSALLFLALPFTTQAGSDAAITLGTGPGGFDSRAIDVGGELGKLPLRLNAGYFEGMSNGDTNMVQVNSGMDWKISETVTTQINLSRIDDDIFIMKGGDIGLNLHLNQYWQSKQSTVLKLGYGRMDYTPDTERRLPEALLAHLPEQSHYTLGLSQGLTENISVNLSYDKYDYTTDTRALATAIALAYNRRNRNPPNSAFVIAAFPNHTTSMGLAWELGNNISLDLSYSQSETAVGQTLKNTGLGITHTGDVVTFGISLSHSDSSAVINAGGMTVIPSSHGTYLDFRIGMQFN